MIEVPIAPLGGGDVRGLARWTPARGLEIDPGDLPLELVDLLRRGAAAPMLTPVGHEDDPDLVDGVEWIPVEPGSTREAAIAWLAGLARLDALAVWTLATGL